VYFFLYL